VNELILSDDLWKSFESILDQIKKYNKSYYMDILDKIQSHTSLSDKEQNDFEELLNDEKVIEKSEIFMNKLKGFTLAEAENFLDNYSIEDIFHTLIEQSKKEFIDTLQGVYSLHKEYNFTSWKYYIIKNEVDDKYTVYNKWNNTLNWSYEDINWLFEVDWNIYLYALEQWKKYLLPVWENTEDYISFSYIEYKWKYNWEEVFYFENSPKERWYIQLWVVSMKKDDKKSKKYIKHITYNFVDSIIDKWGYYVYYVKNNDEKGCVKLWYNAKLMIPANKKILNWWFTDFDWANKFYITTWNWFIKTTSFMKHGVSDREIF